MCDFCKEMEREILLGNLVSCQLFVIDPVLKEKFTYLLSDIHFCPICGRKLDEEKELPWVTVGMEDDCK